MLPVGLQAPVCVCVCVGAALTADPESRQEVVSKIVGAMMRNAPALAFMMSRFGGPGPGCRSGSSHVSRCSRGGDSVETRADTDEWTAKGSQGGVETARAFGDFRCEMDETLISRTCCQRYFWQTWPAQAGPLSQEAIAAWSPWVIRRGVACFPASALRRATRLTFPRRPAAPASRRSQPRAGTPAECCRGAPRPGIRVAMTRSLVDELLEERRLAAETGE